MEERILKIQFAKAGNGGRTARLTIPIKWLDEMELVPEDREVVAVFNPETKEFFYKKTKKRGIIPLFFYLKTICFLFVFN